MGRKKNSAPGLGKNLIKSRFGKRPASSNSFLHTSELKDGQDWGRLNLQSVTEQSNLDEFLATAELAGTEFAAEKLNIKILNPAVETDLLSIEEERKIALLHHEYRNFLRIPRRPPWNRTMGKEDLEQLERDAFLNWRRDLAMLQEKEHIILTPYEKNLDFWRQLWRVIERSDVVVQIVDARNPLLFRCEDLEVYVKEVDAFKINLILVNKADYLTDTQRDVWADYFNRQNVRVVFWSAREEAERLAGLKNIEEEEDGDEDTDVEGKESGDKDMEIDAAVDQSVSSAVTNTLESSLEGSMVACETATEEDSSSMMSRNKVNLGNLVTGPELLDILRSVHTGPKVQEGIITIGMVGYPNVGKSSTINAILQMKKVPVSATPGRTKHFQTLFVDKSLMLCDCPGLVFPSFVSTKADLIVNGILPIDQMRDCIAPVSLVCQRIPRTVLEDTYGINIPVPFETDGEDPNRPPTAQELLSAYAYMRGFMTQKGLPDCPRSSRVILKDYVNGKLLYCHPPPGVAAAGFQASYQPRHSRVNAMSSLVDTRTSQSKQSRIDADFFSKMNTVAHSKGVQGRGEFVRAEGLKQIVASDSDSGSIAGSQSSFAGKPWKKHHNHGKKEKLRRVYAEEPYTV